MDWSQVPSLAVVGLLLAELRVFRRELSGGIESLRADLRTYVFGGPAVVQRRRGGGQARRGRVPARIEGGDGAGKHGEAVEEAVQRLEKPKRGQRRRAPRVQ